MIIIQEDSENYTYKNKKYRYGELSLNFINYKREDTKNKNLYIEFKDDFKSNYCGDNYTNLHIFVNTYIGLGLKVGDEKQKYILENKKLLNLLHTPYRVVMHHDFKTNTIQMNFETFQNFLIFDLYYFCRNDTFILQCPYCKNLFITKTFGEKVYCSNTCRMKYSNALSQYKISQNPIVREYYRLRKNYSMRIDRNPEKYSEEIFLNWNDTALKLKKECKSDEDKYYEFEKFLKEDPFAKE